MPERKMVPGYEFTDDGPQLRRVRDRDGHELEPGDKVLYLDPFSHLFGVCEDHWRVEEVKFNAQGEGIVHLAGMGWVNAEYRTRKVTNA